MEEKDLHSYHLWLFCLVLQALATLIWAAVYLRARTPTMLFMFLMAVAVLVSVIIRTIREKPKKEEN